MRHTSGRLSPYRVDQGFTAQIEIGTDPETGKRKVATRTFKHVSTGAKGLTKADVAKTEQSARAWLSEVRAALDAGTYGKVAEVPKGLPTLQEIATEHFARQAANGDLSINTHSQYLWQMNRYLKPFLSMPLDEIKRRDVIRHYDAMRAEGGSPASIKKANDAASSAAQYACDMGEIEINPFRQLPLPKKNKGKRTTFVREDSSERLIWTKDHARTYFDYHGQQPDDPETGNPGRVAHPLLDLYRLQLDSCARRSEVLGLRWVDVDIDSENPMIRIRWTAVVNSANSRLIFEETTKTDESRRDLTIAPSTAAHLATLRERQRERADLLGVPFHTVKTAGVEQRDMARICMDPRTLVPVRPERYRRVFELMCEAAGVPYIGTHGLRATGLTWVAEDRGVVAARKRAGHTSLKTTGIYVQSTDEQDREAAAVMESVLG